MKIYYSHASPFARKCRITLRLKGLLSQFDEIEALPMSNPPELIAVNPIVQVPAIILNDGTAVFNSHLICAYLDKMGDTQSVYGANELETRRIETIGDGVAEMAVKIAMENRRPENERSPSNIARWQENIIRTLPIADKIAGDLLNTPINLGTISIVTTLTYIAFRFPNIDWKKHKNLLALHTKYEAMKEFIETQPQ